MQKFNGFFYSPEGAVAGTDKKNIVEPEEVNKDDKISTSETNEDGKKYLTQEEFNEVIQKRLARDREVQKEKLLKDPDIVAALNAKKVLDELKKSGMTEPEKLNSQLEEEKEKVSKLEKENAEYKSYKIRQAALEKVGLPASFADRVHGTTEEEIEEDVKSLKSVLKTAGISTVALGGAGNPGNGSNAGSKLADALAEAVKNNDIQTEIRIKRAMAFEQKK